MTQDIYVLLKKSINHNTQVVGVYSCSDAITKRNELIGLDSSYTYEIQGPFKLVDTTIKPLFPEIYNPFLPNINPFSDINKPVIGLPKYDSDSD